MVLQVTRGERRVVGPGETAYVYGGGLVEAHGGRVHVGTGGACVADGGARVSLVADGQGDLWVGLVGPIAVVADGEVYAETGTAFLRGASTYRATGTAEILVTAAVKGQIEDGRLVATSQVAEADVLRRGDELLSATAARDDRRDMEAEPGEDLSAWLEPLVEELVGCGARVTRSPDGGGPVQRRLKADRPADVARCALGGLAVPPTVRVVVRSEEVEFATDFGARIVVHRAGLLDRLRP